MFTVFTPSTDFLGNPRPHCQRSSFAYTAKPNLNNHRPQRIGLPGQRRTPTPLMEPVPPFRGIRKLADSPSESKGILQTFDNFRILPRSFSLPPRYGAQYHWPERPQCYPGVHAVLIALTCHLVPDWLGCNPRHFVK